MIEKRDFVERTIYLIRKLLEDHLPQEDTLAEMIDKRNKLLQKFIQ